MKRLIGLVIALALVIPTPVSAGPAGDALTALENRVAALEARVTALEAPKPSATPAPTATATPTPAPVPTPIPTANPSPQTYDATYIAKGGDETASLKAFVEGNRGKHVGLVGTIGVTSTRWSLPPGATTTVDFLNGASLRAIDDRATATLFLYESWDLILNDPAILGRGYGTYHPTLQWQHGIGVYGGGRITINRPKIDSTFGDGIDVDIDHAGEPTPVAVAINAPVITRACRNGITINAGQVTVAGGSIDQTGLHSIDLEPNADPEAISIDARISGIRITRASNMPVFDVPGQIIRGRAISGLGGPSVFGTKKRIDIQNTSSDDFQFAVDHAAIFVFTGNRSDSIVAAPAKTVFYSSIGTKTIGGNVNITPVEYAFR